MKKGDIPFGTIITIILIIIILAIGLSILGGLNFPLKIEQAVSDAEKLAASYEAAQSICPGDRLSEPIRFQIQYRDWVKWPDKNYMEMSNSFMVWIYGTEDNEGEWIIYSLHQYDKVADYAGLWSCPCLRGGDYKRASYQFTINDTTTSESKFSFFPDCSKGTDVTGCCVKGVETGDKPPYDCCYYEDYNWEYFGQDDLGLNVVIPNGHIVKVWSRTKVKHAGSDQGDANKCDIGGGSIKTFQTDDFDYYEGRLNMTYSVCCPEGYIYNSSLQACCSDILCKNIECFLDGGYWFYEACWYPSASGQTCDTRCNAVGRTCDPMSMQYTENNCRLHEKVFGVGPACEASAPSTNSVAPYLNLITGKYYYYNATDVINHFNCTHSGANLRRICPCS